MKVYLFYRPQSESDVAVSNYLRLFADRQQTSMILMDVHTREGDDLGRLYDILSYPTVLVTTDDGQQIRLWHGSLPPTIELTPYVPS